MIYTVKVTHLLEEGETVGALVDVMTGLQSGLKVGRLSGTIDRGTCSKKVVNETKRNYAC